MTILWYNGLTSDGHFYHMNRFFVVFYFFLAAPLFSIEQETGWFFYKDPREEKINKLPKLTQKQAHEQFIQLQEDLKEKRFLAILEPSTENLQSFIEAQQQSLMMASRFAQNWKKALVMRPELDPTVKAPTSYAGNIEHRKSVSQKLSSDFKKALAGHRFFLFYSSNCPYCDLMYRTLSSVDGLEMIPVSMDGATKYPNSIPYERLGVTLPITVTPYIWAMDTEQNLTPVCAGAKDLATFKNLFLAMVTREKEISP